jgi:cytoskeletal protein RodZ
VAHLFDNHPDDAGYEAEQVPAPQRKRWVTIAIAVVLLAVIGASSAVLWRSYGGRLPALPSFASGTEPAAAPAAVVADKPVGSKDFQALQQQIAGSAQSTAQLLATQQAEIKRLADQVAVLAAKVDLLERPAASAQASLPAPQPAAPAARKKPAAPKPPPGISTGGAPLPVTPSR